MPQHWAGRFCLRSRWLATLIVAVALTTTAAQPAPSAAGSGDGSALLSLPWTPGTAWRLTGGPHSEAGTKVRPWSAVDFQPIGETPGKVRAARGGWVVRPCPNQVVLRHADGWSTSYYHLKGIAVSRGEWAARGELLGYASSAAGCGGYATGPHLHFSLMRDKSYVNIRDHIIGGWTVREGSAPYAGCMVKGDDRQCASIGRIHNTGSIGSR